MVGGVHGTPGRRDPASPVPYAFAEGLKREQGSGFVSTAANNRHRSPGPSMGVTATAPHQGVLLSFRYKMSSLFPYVALLPTILLLLAAMAYPVGYSLYLSVLDFRLGQRVPPKFVGLGNYVYVLNDPMFWQSLRQTLFFAAFSLLFEMVVALGLALVLARPMRAVGLMRGIVLLPWMIASAVAAVVWALLFEGSYGPINYAMVRLGLYDRPVPWLTIPGVAMWVLIALDVWRETPVVTMMLVAGLQSIPGELIEAAAIDGAGPWRRFTAVVLPSLRPAIVLALLLRTMVVLRVYDVVAILTGGGPGGTTEVIGTYLYKQAFSSFFLGRASATGIILVVITLAVSLLYLRADPSRREA